MLWRIYRVQYTSFQIVSLLLCVLFGVDITGLIQQLGR